ncbi:MAG: 4Fe-4S dicluster domain-containing protein [Clostridiales bacterium]|nr:4Fe-4S dicluster domain-containing protein [Clostridiales bacterium]
MNDFKNDVRNTPGGANVLNCFLCGSCTACCPVNEIDDDYNPRKIMRMVLLDMEDDVLKSDEIWKCNQCHACVAHCPQDVRFADIVRALREISIERGFRDEALLAKVREYDEELKRQRLEKIKEELA